MARPDDAERAGACAVAMQIAMEEVNAFNRREGLPEVEMGIAVNTGEVIVGNIGSQTRAKYGVVGTHVNLAGRIEGFTVGGQVLVSESTVDKAGGSLAVGERVTFQAKGFQEPVDVYDLRGVGGRARPPARARRPPASRCSPQLPVSVAVLEGKQMSDVTFEGTLLRGVARARPSLRSERAAARLHATSACASRARTASRARATSTRRWPRASTEPDGGVLVRFTSADPEVMDALLRQAARLAARARRGCSAGALEPERSALHPEDLHLALALDGDEPEGPALADRP